MNGASGFNAWGDGARWALVMGIPMELGGFFDRRLEVIWLNVLFRPGNRDENPQDGLAFIPVKIGVPASVIGITTQLQ